MRLVQSSLDKDSIKPLTLTRNFDDNPMQLTRQQFRTRLDTHHRQTQLNTKIKMDTV